MNCLASFFFQNICLDAGHALSLFAYNNKAQQKAIRQMGGIPVKTYENFLNSDNEIERAKAAFQVVRRYTIYIQYIYTKLIKY